MFAIQSRKFSKSRGSKFDLIREADEEETSIAGVHKMRILRRHSLHY